jgi:hypothetical protein
MARLAEEPELTIMKCLTDRYCAIRDSKSLTFCPMVRLPEFRTDTAACISSGLKPLEARGTFMKVRISQSLECTINL